MPDQLERGRHRCRDGILSMHSPMDVSARWT
jgi:hypothetical protein